jgi:hypothetical protein
MSPEWNLLIDRLTLYRPKQLGGKKQKGDLKGKAPERGLLGISYDTVIREIVNNPKYRDDVKGKWNPAHTHRSCILIPGWVVLQWLEDNPIPKAA